MLEAFACHVRGKLAAVDCLVQDRKRLRAEEGRREELVVAGDLDPLVREVEHGADVDDEPGHAGPHIGCMKVTTLHHSPCGRSRVAQPGPNANPGRFGAYEVGAHRTGVRVGVSISILEHR